MVFRWKTKYNVYYRWDVIIIIQTKRTMEISIFIFGWELIYCCSFFSFYFSQIIAHYYWTLSSNLKMSQKITSQKKCEFSTKDILTVLSIIAGRCDWRKIPIILVVLLLFVASWVMVYHTMAGVTKWCLSNIACKSNLWPVIGWSILRCQNIWRINCAR